MRRLGFLPGRVLAGCFFFAALAEAMISPVRAQPTLSSGGPVSQVDWNAYRAKFVHENGRVIDDANGGISHSESQGYGLLLAYLAGDRAAFERIWTFTRVELLIRDDGLAAWRWDPKATPHVTDINNATDGDILIAYALGLAGTAWKVPGYVAAGRKIATAIGATVVKRHQDKWLLMPGATGFDRADRPDGPVVNLSYWVFEAFPVLARLAPQANWDDVSKQGLALIDSFVLQGKVVPEWTSVQGKPVPADRFEPVFGYNALRVPLYLLRAGLSEPQRLTSIHRAWAQGPGVVEIGGGRVKAPLNEPGYRVLQAAIACAVDGTRIPEELRRFEPTQYYPSTIHLLTLSLISGRYPQCL